MRRPPPGSLPVAVFVDPPPPGCRAESPDFGLFCTEPAGHTGEHKAMGVFDDDPLETWSDEKVS